ncbi:unnamed protein product [Gordionus sp. m RMFG-2023]
MGLDYERTYSSDRFGRNVVSNIIKNQIPLAKSPYRSSGLMTKIDRLKNFSYLVDQTKYITPTYMAQEMHEYIMFPERDLAVDLSKAKRDEAQLKLEQNMSLKNRKSWTQIMLNRIAEKESLNRHHLNNDQGETEDEITINIDIDLHENPDNKKKYVDIKLNNTEKNYTLKSGGSEEMVFKKDHRYTPSPIMVEKMIKKSRFKKKFEKDLIKITDNVNRYHNIIPSQLAQVNKEKRVTLHREWQRKRLSAIQNFKKEREIILKSWVDSSGKNFMRELNKEFRRFLDGLYGNFETYIEDIDGDFEIFTTTVETKQREKDEAFVEELRLFWNKEKKKLNEEWEEQNAMSLKNLEEESDRMEDVVVAKRIEALRHAFEKRWKKSVENVLNNWIEEKADFENKVKENLKMDVLKKAGNLGKGKNALLKEWQKDVMNFNKEFQQKIDNLKIMINNDFTHMKAGMEKDIDKKIQAPDKGIKLGRTLMKRLDKRLDPSLENRISNIISDAAIGSWENKTWLFDEITIKNREFIRKKERSKKEEKDSLIDPQSRENFKVYVEDARRMISNEREKLDKEIESNIEGAYKSLISESYNYPKKEKNRSYQTPVYTKDAYEMDPFEMLTTLSSVNNSECVLSHKKIKGKPSLNPSSPDWSNEKEINLKEQERKDSKDLIIPLTKSVSFIIGDIAESETETLNKKDDSIDQANPTIIISGTPEPSLSAYKIPIPDSSQRIL